MLQLFRRKEKVKNTIFDNDWAFHSLYELAQENTQMTKTDNELRRRRHYTLLKLLETAPKTGDIAEVGCWRGLSAFQIAWCRPHAPFHIFDSFEGLSEFSEIDKMSNEKRDLKTIQKSLACSLEIVENNLRPFSVFSNIIFYRGWVPTRFNEVKDKTFSFVHIDVDLYEPTKDSLEFFYPRLCKGGIMAFDDYGCIFYPGAKKAIDEYLKDKDVFFASDSSGEGFLVKENGAN